MTELWGGGREGRRREGAKWQGEGAECEICTKTNMATVQNLRVTPLAGPDGSF